MQLRECPFFYGYVILALCTLVKTLKACGQNNTLGYATPTIISDPTLGLGRTAYSSVSSGATLIGALLQPALGLLTDRAGARVVLPLFIMLLGAGLFILAALREEDLHAWLYPTAVLAVVLIRGFAIGGLEGAANANINQWFVARRGRAMAVTNLFMTLAQLIAYSQLYQYSVGAFGWRLTMQLSAVAILTLVLPCAIFLRRTPGVRTPSAKLPASGCAHGCGCCPQSRAAAAPIIARRPADSRQGHTPNYPLRRRWSRTPRSQQRSWR